MYVVFLAGGIASGKSTLARLLQAKGAIRIDLDEVSRKVLAAQSPLLAEIAQVFGNDVLDSAGNLKRGLLARKAFATKEATRQLEAIELPAILTELKRSLSRIKKETPHALCVVEIPRLDRMGDALDLADEIVVVGAPLAQRLERAKKKGMSPQDFTQRAALQPNDEELVRIASSIQPSLSCVIHNAGDPLDLEQAASALVERAKDSNTA